MSSPQHQPQQLSPDQVKRIQENKNMALEKQAARKRAAEQQEDRNRSNAASSSSNAQPGAGSSSTADTSNINNNYKKRKSGMNLKYYEYNLSTMKDSKGGFLVDETPEQEEPQPKAREPQRKAMFEDEPIELDPSLMPRCNECDSMDIEYNYKKHYNVLVCKACIEKLPDKYSLLTKTECAKDYMLTNSELQDRERLPTWEKPNPHKSTWSDMQLFLRQQVEAFALTKYGSLDKMDEVFETREKKKGERKEQKELQKMRELRQKTRTSTWKKVETAHVHTYGEEVYDQATNTYIQTCEDCGISISFESL
ncbi:hypothetical protein SmJEL517_g00585 [Synchytrium microbalum]|uniref:XPA C-terminal domain-containing protein n=1 Tax=Synchytrium microbalum TaxID=1806994 RepID=A0A507CDP0_9FUNG|nr:uncharacterized protein SmJEL517_g00585 [Synchytrium microbalum]TPX37458.1 hypothetical protein SmJEL517_g00585 [Synchytrium microbalum]